MKEKEKMRILKKMRFSSVKKEQKLLNRFEKYLHSDDEELHPGVEGEIPISDKAWGKKKNIFYHTDYVDDELGGMYVYKYSATCYNSYPG